jgi:manganese/zinc/iron transport system substrate-binding protein
MMKKIVLLMAATMLLVGCGMQSSFDEGKVKVVTTVGMLGDMAENIGGDLVDVQNIMGPGVDPHLYQPSAGDISLMEDADIVFYVGLHLEGKMVEIFEHMSETKAVVASAEEIDKEELLLADSATQTYDPHIWFDVALWIETIEEVETAFADFDPDNAEVYAANAESYMAELLELNEWVLETVAELPEDQRVLITAHDAFEYFGRAYGFEVKGIQGISTASDYGLKDLETLIDFIVEREIKAVFVESSVSTKSIEALQEGVQGKDWDLQIGGELFSDAMGNPDTEEGTYLGMVRHNVNTIVNALK